MEKRSARIYTAKFKLQIVAEAKKITMVTSYRASATWLSRSAENVSIANGACSQCLYFFNTIVI